MHWPQSGLIAAQRLGPDGLIQALSDVAAITVEGARVDVEGHRGGRSGKRSHEMFAGSQLVVVESAPHGFDATHPDHFNAALLALQGH